MSEKNTDIIKGFNNGYLLRKHDPLLAEKLHKGFVNKEYGYALGFIKGIEEYQKELVKERSKNYEFDVHRTKNRIKTKSKDLDRG